MVQVFLTKLTQFWIISKTPWAMAMQFLSKKYDCIATESSWILMGEKWESSFTDGIWQLMNQCVFQGEN